jgi:hypothetical protein
MKIALIFVYFSSVSCSFAQQSPKSPHLLGTYHFYNDDTTLHYLIRLDSNNSFYFSISSDLVEKNSTGKWEFLDDTLFLTSKYQVNNIGLQVIENTKPSDEVEFSSVRNLKGQLLATALVFINGDTTKLCDPLAGDCKFLRGSIKSINVVVGKIISSTYSVKNLQANKFSFVLDVDNYLNNYIFLRRSKFLVRNDLIYLLRNNKIDSIVTKTKANVPIALIKQ